VSRIRKAYEIRFRALLRRVNARRMEEGVRWLTARARKLGECSQISPADALERVYEDLASRKPFKGTGSAGEPGRFLCDSGLGGLARWLRAAGYDAFWQAHIDDDDLVNLAHEISGTILTTDSLLMERRILRDGVIAGYWLPPTLRIAEQLARVFREFRLTVGEPRCMDCGGELRCADKETLRDRIPPRTYRWLDEYFVCSRCNKLLWRGTHWDKISGELKKLKIQPQMDADGRR
jgi:uncharacterized protein with PIN domain